MKYNIKGGGVKKACPIFGKYFYNFSNWRTSRIYRNMFIFKGYIILK